LGHPPMWRTRTVPDCLVAAALWQKLLNFLAVLKTCQRKKMAMLSNRRA